MAWGISVRFAFRCAVRMQMALVRVRCHCIMQDKSVKAKLGHEAVPLSDSRFDVGRRSNTGEIGQRGVDAGPHEVPCGLWVALSTIFGNKCS